MVESKNLIWRAAHTFWQAFSAVFFAVLVLPDTVLDLEGWAAAFTAAGIAGFAAGLSAIKTLISDVLAEQAGSDSF